MQVTPLPYVRGLAYSIFYFPIKPRCYGRVMVGFVGGGGNIAIVTALPLLVVVLLLLLLLLLLLKKVGSARLRESDVHPISPKTPAPQYEPIDRKKRKGKRVED